MDDKRIEIQRLWCMVNPVRLQSHDVLDVVLTKLREIIQLQTVGEGSVSANFIGQHRTTTKVNVFIDPIKRSQLLTYWLIT